MRTGRHQGKGRPILPPMPYSIIGALTDATSELFAYLQSIAPVRNRVPQPIDPPEAKHRTGNRQPADGRRQTAKGKRQKAEGKGRKWTGHG